MCKVLLTKSYITRGVADSFHIELQTALFSAIEQMREKVCGQLDYLQVFKIVTEVKGQKKIPAHLSYAGMP